MRKCLWVVPKGIFPIRDGARVANHALLKAIRPHFNELDILVFSEDKSDKAHMSSYQFEFTPTNIHFLNRTSYKNKITKLLMLGFSFLKSPNLPVTTGSFHTEKLKNEVRILLSHSQYDLIVFDGLHPFSAFKDLVDFKSIPVVYRAHNVESDLWSTAASKENNGLIKKLLLWQGQKMANLELELINRSKEIWNIAEEDLKRFKSFFNADDSKLTFIPVGLDFKKSVSINKIAVDDRIKLLFLGKMDWAPNVDGLKWFLEEVWPHVNHNKLSLQIVGSGDSRWGTELFKAPGINFLGFVQDLEEVYGNSDFSIIPIRYGSGTRIKVIESISKNVPIVSTEMGVQGSGLTDYFKAESAQDWITVLSNLDQSRGQAVAAAAFLELEMMYSPKAIAQKAFNSVKI